jgi:hypothetical protein
LTTWIRRTSVREVSNGVKVAVLSLLVFAAVAVALPATGTVAPRCGKTDVPDLRFKDTNCDGIDGDARRAVFVAPSGNDANPGTMRRPLRSLSAAVQKAAGSGRAVYVQVGSYDVGEGLQLASGVSLFGGYNVRWKRSATYKAVITGAPEAIVGMAVRGVMLQYLTVSASAATGSELSVYGVRLVGSTVKLDHVRVSAGDARKGDDGANAGAGGTAGGAGQAAQVQFGGGSDGTGGGFAGGQGGGSGDGQPGQGPGGGAGGTRGPSGCDCGPPRVDGGTGGRGAAGAAGLSGAGGGAEAAAAGETWVGRDGASGGDGSVGSGGGGGGASGSYVFNGGSASANGCAGGGAGAGGTGGTGGSAGHFGGGSFGVYLWQSILVSNGSTITAGNGGPGGAGRDGGPGGPGGAGGAGYSCSKAGNGGPGGVGGAGGQGGAGGGGVGGPSIGVFRGGGSTATITASTTHAGSGGTGGASTGNAGQSGQASDVA